MDYRNFKPIQKCHIIMSLIPYLLSFQKNKLDPDFPAE